MHSQKILWSKYVYAPAMQIWEKSTKGCNEFQIFTVELI